MIICSHCKTENEENSKFCSSCGNDLTINVDAPANEDLKSLADSLNEQAVHTEKQPFNLNKAISNIPQKIGAGIKDTGRKCTNFFRKIGKKKMIIISCSLAVVIAGTVLTVTYIIPFGPHYFKGNSALKSFDYQTAISEYELAKNFLNTKSKLNETNYAFAEKLYSEENFYDAAVHYNVVKKHEDTESKIIECGTKLLESQEYQKSLEVFEMIKTDDVAQLKNYALGMTKLIDGSYEEAKNCFSSAGEYSDSKSMINACDLMLAENHCKNGDFEKAKAIYAALPEGLAYNGISVTDRISLLNNSQGLINAMGKWNASKYYIETRNVYDRTGSWDSWYIDSDASGQTLTVNCKLNDSNTFDISGTVSYYAYNTYSSLSKYCNANLKTEKINIQNVTVIPASVYINDYTTLNYSGGVFSIKYYERDNYSAHFHNIYSSSVTYGNR